MAHGLAGGWPACNTLCEVWTGTDVRAALQDGGAVEPDALGGAVEYPALQGLVEVEQGSVFRSRADGGGGLGDPLLRAPERVLADVQAGLASVAQARRHYGVVLDGTATTVDGPATATLRAELRVARLGGRSPADGRPAAADEASVGRPVRYELERDATACAACGHPLGSSQANWKLRAVQHEQPLAELGALWTSTRFVLRSFICPGCAALLDTEMTLPTDAPLWDYTPARPPRG
jgi:N-methylhydantoinase B